MLSGSNFRPIYNTGGQQTNPGTSTVMADTGALPYGGIYQLSIVLTASATADFLIQYRNAANDTTTFQVRATCPAAQSLEFVFPLEGQNTERYRVMMGTALTGTATASIVAQRIG